MDTRKYKYDFFISYKHGELDSKVSGYLQKKLESYKIPKEIQKACGKKKITRVFRDEEELSVTLDLTLEIEEQLKNTEYLIVMCSPEAKNSKWVQKEVETFVKYRGWEYVLPVLVQGEPQEAFLDIMLEREMLAADLRGENFKEIKKKCNQEILRLLAPSLKCSFDELKQRHKANVSGRLALTASVVAVFALIFGGYSFNQAQMIQENYWQKMKNQAGLLAETSSQLLKSGDREAALLIALEALPENEHSKEKPLIGAAQRELESALYLYEQNQEAALYPTRVFQMDANYQTRYGSPVYAINEDKDILITCDANNIVYVWDLVEGELLVKYEEIAGINEDIIKILVGKANKVFLCTETKLCCLDYQKQKMIWDITPSEYYSSSEYQLSPDKSQIVAEIFHEINLIDAETGSIVKQYAIDETEWRSYNIVWSPSGKQLCLTYGGFSEQGIIRLLNLETGEWNTLETFDNERYMEVAFKDERTLTWFWVEPYQSGYYSNYYVQEIDYKSGQINWKIQGKCIRKNDDDRSIRYISEEKNGEQYDLTVITVGSAVIGIRDGEIWSEFIYSNKVAGVIEYDLFEVHITEDGGLYRVKWDGPIAMSTEYNTSPLDMGSILATVEIKDGGVVVFPDRNSRAICVFEQVEDLDYTEVENSDEAMTVMYTPNGRYRIAYDCIESYNYVFNIWDLEKEKNIYRREFVYDSQNEQGEHFKGCGCIGNEYFYYYTKDSIWIYGLNTLQEAVAYTYQPESDEYFYSLGNVHSVVGDKPGLYFDNSDNEVYFLSLKSGVAEQVWSVDDMENVYKRDEEEYVYISIIYKPNPTGDYIMFCNSPYQEERAESDIYLWSVNENQVVGSFKLPNDFINTLDADFCMDFSADGKSVLFQNDENGLHIMSLEDMSIELLPFEKLNNQKFWFSPNERYVFSYTQDCFLKVYDRENKKMTTNLECEDFTLEEWYFDGDDLRYTASFEMSQPILFSFRDIGEGEYECYSVISNCERIYNGRAFVRVDNCSRLYSYPFRKLDDMIVMAKEILNGRELTDVERQRYSVEN